MKHNDTVRFVVIGLSAIPFLFSDAAWARASLAVYLLSALLFAGMLIGEYPPITTRAFRISICWMLSIHCIVVLLLFLSLRIPGLHTFPRVLYGILGLVLVSEWRLFLWIIKKSGGGLAEL